MTDPTIGSIQHHESQTVECWCRHCVWWKDKHQREAKAQERERLSQHQATADSDCTCGASVPFCEDWFAHIDPEAQR